MPLKLPLKSAPKILPVHIENVVETFPAPGNKREVLETSLGPLALYSNPTPREGGHPSDNWLLDFKHFLKVQCHEIVRP